MFNVLFDPPGLLKDVPNPENLLSFNQSTDEIDMVRVKISFYCLKSHASHPSLQIKNFVKEAAQAVNDMRVENNDELVVPFIIT